MKKFYFLLCLSTHCIISSAQDPHFSQYYASQSTVNPATTGMFKGDMKVSGLYRQQWPQYGSAFVTGTIALEWKPKGFRDGQSPNGLAFGGMMMYDQAPDAVLKSQCVGVSIAYRKALDEKGNNKLGLGFMAVYNQRTLDASQLTFGNQFGSGGFGTIGGEQITSGKTSSFDINTGLLYSFEDDDRVFYAGTSVYHLLQPKEYFLHETGVMDYIPRRYNAHAGMNIRSENLQYAASALWMRQQKVNEVLIGGMIGIPFGEEGNVLYGGSWYRVGESLIPTINLQWKTINLGLSYDTNISQNKTVAKPGGFELSFAYRIAPFRDYKTGCFAF